MYVREWVRGYVSMLYVGIEYVFMFSCTSVRMWVCGCVGVRVRARWFCAKCLNLSPKS
jgi:hypothetical protein